MIVDDKDLEINLEYLIVTNGGKLIIGTENEPVRSKVQINLYGEMTAQQLPLYGSKVIAIHSGRDQNIGQFSQNFAKSNRLFGSNFLIPAIRFSQRMWKSKKRSQHPQKKCGN